MKRNFLPDAPPDSEAPTIGPTSDPPVAAPVPGTLSPRGVAYVRGIMYTRIAARCPRCGGALYPGGPFSLTRASPEVPGTAVCCTSPGNPE